MKKLFWFIAIVTALIVLVFAVRFIFGGDEDTWIKDGTGEYVEHGKPPGLPKEVEDQQQAIIDALGLYEQKKEEGLDFSSQCLGTVYGGEIGYAVDIVNVPRNEEDNRPENQCEAYRNREVSHFIELDKEGNIVRIV